MDALIKYEDKWRGYYYLTEDLSFSSDRNKAAIFQIDNRDTYFTIYNGPDALNVKEKVYYDTTAVHFISSNIEYDVPFFMITENKTPLCYEYRMRESVKPVLTIGKEPSRFMLEYPFQTTSSHGSFESSKVTDRKFSSNSGIILTLLLVVLVLAIMVNK